MKFNTQRGFTLIELLVVISIIGLLSSIILASLNTARAKGRDAARISDMRQLRIALELYRNDNGSYPTSLASLVPNYIKLVPNDPSGGTGTCRPTYCYAYLPSTNPTSYHMGAQMENTGGVINSDAGQYNPGTYFVSSASYTGQGDFNGQAAYIYDLKN